MYRMIVNGQPAETDRDLPLLDFLRDELRLTSVKNGCGEGTCGACMVLVDGNKQRACRLKLSQVDRKEVLTVEGSIASRNARGGTAGVRVGEQLDGVRAAARALRDWVRG